MWDIIMMSDMTDEMRKLVEIELVRRDMTQKDLAEKVGRKRQQINNTLQGRSGKMPKVWQDILKTFEWKIHIVDKNGNEVR